MGEVVDMNSKKILCIILIIAFLGAASGSIFAIVKANESSRKEEEESLTEERREQVLATIYEDLPTMNIIPEKVWIDGEIIHVSVYASNDTALDARDVLAIRATRNEVRQLAMRDDRSLQGITAMNNKIVGSNGNVMYDATVMEFFSVDEELTDSLVLLGNEPKLSENETSTALQDTINHNGMPLEIKEISRNPLGGYFVRMAIKADSRMDIAKINEVVQNTLSIVEEMNRNGFAISEYRITSVTPGDSRLLYLIDADLIYRDFLWWQAPELGNETWTGSTPNLSEGDNETPLTEP